MPIVYALTCKDPTKIYFGSSIRTKESRFSQHKCNWKRYKDGKDRYCASFELFEIGDVEIHIVMDCPDDISNIELRKIEQIYLDNCECVNMQCAYRSEEKLQEYQKQYKQTDKCKEYMKEYEKERRQNEERKKYMKEYRLKRKEAKIKNIV
jgi:hypothetical protein